MKILIAGRSKEALEAILTRVAQSAVGPAETLLLVNGHHDPLPAHGRLPDVLVLHADPLVAESLKLLSNRPASERPALIVIGDHLPTEAMKHAMRAGARDLIAKLDSDELGESLRRLNGELGAAGGNDRGQIIAVMNGKGGSGGSFVATNLACLYAASGNGETLLIDLDLQYAPLARYIDLTPRRGLVEALAHAHELDEMAVSAYTTRHGCGVDLMAALPDAHDPVSFDPGERMGMLLDILVRRYDRLIIDVPRHLDAAGTEVLKVADKVLIVLQQSLPAVNGAVRLKSILVDELGIPRAHVSSIINRHSKRAALEMRYVREALDEEDPVLIPNEFQLASESVELGEPAVERAPNSSLGRAMAALQKRLDGSVAPPEKGLISRLILRG